MGSDDMGPSSSRRSYLKTVAGIGIGSALAGCLSGEDGNTNWVIGANPSDSPVYTVNVGLAQIADDHVDGLSMDLQTDTGNIPTMRTVSEGEMDAGHTSSSAYWDAAEGRDPFDEPLEPLAQAILPTVQSIEMFLATTPDSDIDTVYDLADHQYSYVARGGATNPMNEMILEEAGVLSDVETVYAGHTETRDAVLEGRTDAFQCFGVDGFTVAGPYADLAEQTGGIKVIEVPQEIRDAVIQRGWSEKPLHPDRFQTEFHNVGDTFPSLAYGIFFIGNEDLDQDIVYDLCEAVFNNIDELEDVSPFYETFGWGDTPREGFDERAGWGPVGADTELAPGAREYYEDNDMPLPGE